MVRVSDCESEGYGFEPRPSPHIQMNYQEIQDFFRRSISYLDWVFYIGRKGETIYLQVQFMAPNNYHPEQIDLQKCRKWQLSEWMIKTELVQTAWAAVQRAVLHEASEQFKYNDADIYNTHMNVELLCDMREHAEDALEHRGEIINV